MVDHPWLPWLTTLDDGLFPWLATVDDGSLPWLYIYILPFMMFTNVWVKNGIMVDTG